MTPNSPSSDSQVAVIIPIFNGAAYIRETVASILRQSQVSFVVYLVDDGSTDETPNILEQLSQDPRVRVLSQTNQGQAAAINHGLAVSKEPYIALCDVDDVWCEDRLQKTVEKLENNDQLTMVCSDFCRGHDPEEGWDSAWQAYGYNPSEKGAFARLLTENFVCRSAVLMRRREIERCGNFSEAIGGRCGADDRDMWLRLAREGDVGCIDEILVWKRICPDQGSTSVGFNESQVRLWQAWIERLAGEKEYQHLAVKNLVTVLHDLAWNFRKTGRAFQSIMTELKILRYRPQLLTVAMNVMKTLIAGMLKSPSKSAAAKQ